MRRSVQSRASFFCAPMLKSCHFETSKLIMSLAALSVKVCAWNSCTIKFAQFEALCFVADSGVVVIRLVGGGASRRCIEGFPASTSLTALRLQSAV